MSYDDIILLPHPVSARHPQMPLADRAAQFSPFAALTGHEAAIRETARLTDSLVELEESGMEQLDRQLQLIRDALARQPEVEVTYFRPDERKSGGAYATVRGRVKKIEEYEGRLVFADGTAIPLENILSMGGEIFGDMQ